MKWFALVLLGASVSVSVAQRSVESYASVVTPGAPGTNSVVPEGLSLQADGNISLSTRTTGSSQAKTHFSKVSFDTGLPFLHREGIALFDPNHTTLGPGFRVAQVGYASGTGYDAAARVFSATGTTLMSIVDNIMGGTLNEQNTASAFDGAGNLYVAGLAFPSFSTTAGSFTYVAKYSPTGVRLWRTTSGLPALSGNYDFPVSVGINTQGDVWVAIARGSSSTHVWKLNGLTGSTQFGSVWQIGGTSTSPVTAKMINNRFVVVGNNNSTVFVRQFISPSAWITSQLDVGVGQEVAHDVFPSRTLATEFSVAMIRQNTGTATGHVEKLNLAGSLLGGFSLGPMTQLNQVHDYTDAVYAVGQSSTGDTVVSFVPRGVTTAPIQHLLGRPNEFTRYSVAKPSGEVVVATKDTNTPARTRLTKITFGPQAVDNSAFYFGAIVSPPSGNVMANDLHTSGATVTIVQQPDRGFVTLGSSGNFTYTHEPGSDVGTFEFSYEIQKPGFTATIGREVMILRP